ncbi:hypothetical protein [Flavobacterium sp.]|uniref:hypothetical protein n=1 Tax=Flavobacterium sp. TaxID=239 RepID=UPI0025C1ED24|nr:hypothetical protein [Flavobacterium sp.]
MRIKEGSGLLFIINALKVFCKNVLFCANRFESVLAICAVPPELILGSFYFQRIKIRCYKICRSYGTYSLVTFVFNGLKSVATQSIVPSELNHVVVLFITDFIPSYKTDVIIKEP